MKRFILITISMIALAVALSACSSPKALSALSKIATTTSPLLSSPPAPISIRVEGNQLVNGHGQQIRLLGVDRSGSEYACITGSGYFNGPTDAASVRSIRSWDVNAVRLPLNEDCWLGINGAPITGTVQDYRSAIIAFVNTLNNQGIYVILDLHWSDPGTLPAKAGQPMADADHSPAFWHSVAMTFKSNHAVLFDLYSEPQNISWACLEEGCQQTTLCNQLNECTPSAPWNTASMASLVQAVRSTGATQPIMLGGVNYASDLSQWLAFEPFDPDHQLVASVHVYQGANETPGFWDSTIGVVAAKVPVVSGEIGESDCGTAFIDEYMSWADSHAVSYLAWEWDTVNSEITCENGPSLILTYDGVPTTYGAGFEAHLAQVAALKRS